MAIRDLIKIAPTLSAEERYKILVPDLHRQIEGEKSLISESECRAITKFENKAIWEEYVRSISIFQWAQAFLPKDIEAEKLRVLGCSLFLSHALERVLRDGGEPIPKEKRAVQFKNLKESVATFEEQSAEFYSYPEAIKKIEEELYGVPLFNEKRKKQIAGYYAMADELIEHHNNSIHMFCGHEIIKKTITPIVQDTESYLVKKPIPDPVRVERIVDEIRQIADSETEMLGR